MPWSCETLFLSCRTVELQTCMLRFVYQDILCSTNELDDEEVLESFNQHKSQTRKLGPETALDQISRRPNL